MLAFRQCHRRLWLEIRRPDLRDDASGTQASFRVGHEVGNIARRLYDPQGRGALVDPYGEGFENALSRTTDLLTSNQPIFEAGFSANGALAFADVLLPVRSRGRRRWRMVEIKSTASMKDYHADDAAVQAFVARSAGVPLSAIAVANIDSQWVYPGGDDYVGLLKECDVTAQAFRRGEEVQSWIAEAHAVARWPTEPGITTGGHCQQPYSCGFIDHCSSQEPMAEHPVTWLPNVRTKALKSFLAESGASELRDVPDDLLNEVQSRVKAHTLSGEAYFDAAGARGDLVGSGWPAYFMDFETINLAVPIWRGIKPYPLRNSTIRMSLQGRWAPFPL